MIWWEWVLVAIAYVVVASLLGISVGCWLANSNRDTIPETSDTPSRKESHHAQDQTSHRSV